MTMPQPTPQQLADAVRNDLELIEFRGYTGTIAIHTLDLRAVFDVLDAALASTPTDAQVEAVAQAMFEDPLTPGDYTWAQMVTEDPTRADLWRADARRVLEAAREARS